MADTKCIATLWYDLIDLFVHESTSAPVTWSCIARRTSLSTGSPSSLYEPHEQHNMASNYKGFYGIFYKISMEVVKVKILNKNGLPYFIRVLFAPGVVILPIELDLSDFF